MSYAVTIDYEGISIECQCICEMAAEQLCQLDKMLDAVERSSSRLLDSSTEGFRQEISKTKRELQDKIDAVISRAKKNAEMSRVTVYSDDIAEYAYADTVLYQAKELRKMAARLAGTKLPEYEALLNRLMNGRLTENNEKLRSLALGGTRIDSGIMARINSVSDGVMRQYVYLAHINDPDADFDTLCAAAAQMKEEAEREHFSEHEDRKLSEIKTQLKKENIGDEIIEKIVNQSGSTAKERLQKAAELAQDEIVGEKIRRESVKIIVRAIKKRGFFVDNDSIKIDREKNLVNIIARKPSGAKAAFRVYLDGKFEYRFDGYEGQACQKDIQPFMKDLEEVYGIRAVKQTEIWRNPDKNSSMKEQTINYNSKKE